jgi:DNA-binding MarR family transcriptional regulator
MVKTISTPTVEELKPIEIFLLVAVGKLGLRTLYELKRVAGLEPGSIRGLIAQLERQGLLVRSDHKERRGARPMELTADGRACIANHWMQSLNPNKEMESLLRSATVALAMGDASVASKFLRQSMSARERHRGPLEVSAATLRKGPVEFHAEAREIYAWRRRAFEAVLLRELGCRLDQAEASGFGGEPPRASQSDQR